MERLISRSKSLIKYFKYKKIIFAPWRADDVNDSPYHAWYLPLRKYCSNIIFFDPAKNYFKYGKRQMNDMLLSLVKKEKPDYIIFSLLYDEFNLRIFDEIRKISPDTLLINFFNDDDWRFNDFTLFYVTFFDYVITSVTSEDVKSFYKGISNVLFYSAVNCELFRPLSLNKKYDVTFVGRPNKSRVDYLIFLAENGVDIKIWGDGWASYPKLLRYYKGYLSAEDFPKVINESRINLSFSQGGYGKPQRKGRYYEASACRSFSLVEEYDAYRKYFSNNEIVMFKDKEDLLKKVRHYLANEKETSTISKRAHKKIIKYYHQDILMVNILTELMKLKKRFLCLNSAKGNCIGINLSELMNMREETIRKIKQADFVYFTEEGVTTDTLRLLIQKYSLERTGKFISCCDYYVNSNALGDYALFKAYRAFKKISSQNFNSLLILPQLLVKKDYFLSNLNIFRKLARAEHIKIDDKDITFVSIPLLRVKSLPIVSNKLSLEDFSYAFQPKFLDTLYSLYYQKKLFTNKYIYLLFMKSLAEKQILRVIWGAITDKGKLNKIRSMH